MTRRRPLSNYPSHLHHTHTLSLSDSRYIGSSSTLAVKIHVKRSADGGGGGGGGAGAGAGSSAGGAASSPLAERWALYFTDLRDRIAAADAPGLLAYQHVCETARAGYLIRQHFAANLYDRFSTHPFLAGIEKRWIAYQLIRAVAQMHAIGVCHGDIKSENVMVTSWNWIFLTDFAPFKPTWLPDNNPTDVNFFFQSDRARCYIAPERFYSAVEALQYRDPNLMPSMDIFSLGCVLAEIFLEGETVFDLAQLLQYRDRKQARPRRWSPESERKSARKDLFLVSTNQ